MTVTPEHRLALAVDIGGTKVDAALIDARGSLRPDSRHRVATGAEADRKTLLAAIDSAVSDALDACRESDVLVGAGIGSAGPISLEDNSISPLNLPALHGLRIRDFLRAHVGDVDVTLRLDGTCIALAEHWLGSTRDVPNSLSMVVSTGIGGGIILGGRLIAGRSGNAGHIGQIQVGTRPAGESSRSVSLENLASGPHTVAWAREYGWNGTCGEELGADYRADVPIAIDAVRRSTTAVGEAIASVATLLDLGHIAIGGGFINVADDYIDQVEETIRTSAIFDYARRVAVTRSSLGGDGPLIGAAALIHRSELL